MSAAGLTSAFKGFGQRVFGTHCRKLISALVQVPVTLVYNKHAVDRSKPAALHLKAYGAYEITYDPDFSRNELSLIDRGIICAIAHVRGGGDLGRQWYETGKYLLKKNTFLDVIAGAEHLVSEGWTTAKQMTFEGRSAGGLTAGAVANMRPDLFTVRSRTPLLFVRITDNIT
jgi:oligopeptidase B